MTLTPKGAWGARRQHAEEVIAKSAPGTRIVAIAHMLLEQVKATEKLARENDELKDQIRLERAHYNAVPAARDTEV